MKDVSLISCPECGKEISDQSSVCPSCGYPIKSKQANTQVPEENGIHEDEITESEHTALKVSDPEIVPYEPEVTESQKKTPVSKKNKVIVFASIGLVIIAGIIAAILIIPNRTHDTTMSYKLTYQDVDYTGTYTGTVQKKIPNGEGTFSFDDNNNVFTYNGEWSDGKLSGTGSLTDSQFLIHFSDIDRQGSYVGATTDGIPNGTGSFSATNDAGSKYCYTGAFQGGTFNGQGERKFENSSGKNEIGTFTAGDFTPSPKELFAYLGRGKNSNFGIRSMSADFLSAHEDIFTSHLLDGLDALTDTGFWREAYTKSPDKYGDKLIKLTSLKIDQIQEFKELNYDAITFMIANDSDYNVYYIYYIGSLDIYEGDYISAYLLPLDYFTYKNVNENDIWAIACAGAYITK